MNKVPTRLAVAIAAALVLPIVLPGFAWLIPSWFVRTLFTFGFVYIAWGLFTPRALAPIAREKSPVVMAFWALVAALMITGPFTAIFGFMGSMLGGGFGFFHREQLFRAMALFAIVCFTLTSWGFMRKNHVI